MTALGLEERETIADSDADTATRLLAIARAGTLEQAVMATSLLPGFHLVHWAMGRRIFPGGFTFELTPSVKQQLEEHERVEVSTLVLGADLPFETAVLCPLAEGVIAILPFGFEPSPMVKLVATLLARSPAGCSPASVAKLLRLDHDLRNPLCAITLNVHLLNALLAREGDSRALDRVRSIGESSQKMLDLLEALAAEKRARGPEAPKV